MTFRSFVLFVFAVALALPRSAPGFSHVTDYRANFENYRYCAGTFPPLGTCTYDDARSPSLYNLSHATKGSVQMTSTGTVKLRIDNIALDTGISFACQDLAIAHCVSGVCQGPPRQGTICSNDGQCAGPACLGGPQNQKLCSGSSQCSSLDNSSGWKVRFRGNESSYIVQLPNSYYRLFGSSDGTGCATTCDFTLANDSTPSVGSVNSDGLTCSQSGDCDGNFTETIEIVEVLDPDGNVLARPTLGSAVLPSFGSLIPGDPAKIGDACRTEVPPPADCP